MHRGNAVDLHVRVETKSTTPLCFSAFQRLLIDHGVQRLQVQVASQASSSFPAHALDSHDSIVYRGPSGVRVTVDYLEEQQGSFQDILSALHRIVLAPLASVDVPRLHRFVTTSTPKHQSLILPTEGSAALSAEGMRAFVRVGPADKAWHDEEEGVWGVADSVTWSNWMLGIPEAVRGGRRGYWMDWHTSPSSNVTSFSKGVQYTVRIPRLPTVVSLQDVIPTRKTEFERFPFADSTHVEVVQTDDSYKLEWAAHCRNHDRQELCELHDTPVDEPLFRLTTSTDSSTATTTTIPYWSVDWNVWRSSNHGGTFHTTVQNHRAEPVNVTVFQRIPAVVTPLWRTLTITLSKNATTNTLTWLDLHPHQIDFDDKGSDLVFGYELAENSQLSLRLDYDPAFLSPLEAFPGDPNRGVELPPVRAVFATTTTNTTVELFSNTLLLLPPLPDLSMPFNVLSLTCTLYVFVVGSLLNLLIRRASQAVQQQLGSTTTKPPSKLARIKDKLSRVLQKLRRKKQEQDSSPSSSKVAAD